MNSRLSRFVLDGVPRLAFLRDYGRTWRALPHWVSRATGLRVRYTLAPFSIQLEPTNHCNLRCICCARSRSSRPLGFMDFPLYRRIVNDASRSGVRRIQLYLHGEPLLHPQIVEMIGHAKSSGLMVTVATNGMLFDEGMAKAILALGLSRFDIIQFSILGHSTEVHESIMRGVRHAQVVGHVSQFVRLRKALRQGGPTVETVFYRMPENEHEEERFLKVWSKVVDRACVPRTISKQFAAPGGNGDSLVMRTDPCWRLWERMTVFWNGDVTVCMADVNGERVLGNLGEDSIGRLWRSSALQSLRALHINRRFRETVYCARCDW